MGRREQFWAGALQVKCLTLVKFASQLLQSASITGPQRDEKLLESFASNRDSCTGCRVVGACLRSQLPPLGWYSVLSKNSHLRCAALLVDGTLYLPKMNLRVRDGSSEQFSDSKRHPVNIRVFLMFASSSCVCNRLRCSALSASQLPQQ